MTLFVKLVAAGVVFGSVPVLAQTAQPATPVQAPATPGAGAKTVTLAEGYVLGPGDIVEVSVLGREEFRSRVQVQVDGTVQLPYIKTMVAQNKTIIQFRDEVQRALVAGGFYSQPVVAVNVATYASRYVTVLGDVGSPGLVPVDRAYRVSEIIARVGGLRESAASEIKLRRVNGEELTLPIVRLATGGPEDDPFVNPGDKLYAAKADMFYIYGQVNGPGTYRIDPKMTLQMALARGGGLTSLGSEKRVKLIRGGQEIARYKLGDPIQNGDVIVVGERFF